MITILRTGREEKKFKAILNFEGDGLSTEEVSIDPLCTSCINVHVGDSIILSFTHADFADFAMQGLGMVTPAEKAG